MEFKKELENLINKHGIDNDLNTPDYILVEYIIGVLAVYSSTKRKTEKWFGVGQK